MKIIGRIIALISAAAIALSAGAAFAGEPIFGVDISYHNGTVSFTDLQTNGKDFAMIRLGYAKKLDTKFWENVQAANDTETEFGVYLYSYAYSDADAEAEANFVVNVLSQMGDRAKHFTLPVAYDLEDQKIIDKCVTKEQITKQMNIFCSIIKAAGYTPMIYANRNWLLNYIDINEIVKNDYKLWYAYWPNKVPTDFSKQIEVGSTGVKADMWQYVGVDDASSTVFDLNVIYDAAALITPNECEHNFEAETVLPTTEAGGYTLHKCTVCGREFKTNFTSQLFVDGWNYINEKWYYCSDNVIASGWWQIKGKWYYFDSQGVMQTGWVKAGSTWYCLAESGEMLTGWLYDGEFWYYLDENGAMQKDWQLIGGKWYYLNPSGDMAIGWKYLDGKWYLFGNSGAMLTGWQYSGGKWYYFRSGGTMLTGWLIENGKWYYLDKNGAMLAKVTRKINGKTYKFNSSGVCLNP